MSVTFNPWKPTAGHSGADIDQQTFLSSEKCKFTTSKGEVRSCLHLLMKGIQVNIVVSCINVQINCHNLPHPNCLH
jgi:hypothetical protein